MIYVKNSLHISVYGRDVDCLCGMRCLCRVKYLRDRCRAPKCAIAQEGGGNNAMGAFDAAKTRSLLPMCAIAHQPYYMGGLSEWVVFPLPGTMLGE
jgi:hypothetical protein